MSFWSKVKDWFTLAPDAPGERARSRPDPWSVNIIDGVAVPGAALVGPPNYRRGMSIPAGWRCAMLLADLLGGVPWHVYRQENGRAVRMNPTPPLIERPDPRPNTSRMDTMSSSMLDMIWDGNVIWIIAANDSEGWPTAVLPVPTRICGVRRAGRD